MKIASSLLFLLLVLVFAVEADFEWMYLIKYGENVTLKPLKPVGAASDYEYSIEASKCYWLLPTGQKLGASEAANTNNYSINTEKCELTIFNIQKEDNGIYHVFLNETYVTKAMLNYHGPPYENFLDEYGTNLIAAFSTAGGILALFVFIYVLRMFSYKNRNKKIESIEPTSDGEMQEN